jgi:hypothetical protein
MGGEYDELVMAVITPPRVETGKPLPKAAFYPFVVATSTEASREHAIERWHLPHYMQDLDFDFRADGDTMTVEVSENGAPVLDLTVTSHEHHPQTNPYHAFTVDHGEGTPYKVNIFMQGPHSEHEFEEGSLTLHDHPMTEMLTHPEVETIPFREEWYQAGVQTFEELEEI